MAFCTHCVTICNTLCDGYGFISCSSCGKVLGQVKRIKKINSHVIGKRCKKVKRIRKINSQITRAVEEAAK